MFSFPDRSTVPVSSFLTQKSGLSMLERSFVGDDGRRYTWIVKGSQFEAHVVEDGRRGAPIANFHRRAFFGSENAYLELFPGYEGTLDSLIVTFLFTEWKRRQSGGQQNLPVPALTVGLSGAGVGAAIGGFGL